ncbi:MAG: hypothetical protein WHS86_16245, partial [Desulfosoma sp.]
HPQSRRGRQQKIYPVRAYFLSDLEAEHHAMTDFCHPDGHKHSNLLEECRCPPFVMNFTRCMKSYFMV